MHRKKRKKLSFFLLFCLFTAYQANIKYCINQVLFSLKKFDAKKMTVRHSDNFGDSF